MVSVKSDDTRNNVAGEYVRLDVLRGKRTLEYLEPRERARLRMALPPFPYSRSPNDIKRDLLVMENGQ